ncbi:hypothetical protein EON64_14575 [archaeon]|nr:MAG: hypothetical protein EON64_14575 [archaeon]
MESDAFSCPLCFETYNDNDFLPTTLPCGHSCCLSHVPVLRYQCFMCNTPFPRDLEAKPTFSLRDGALKYAELREALDAALVVIRGEGLPIPIPIPSNRPTDPGTLTDVRVRPYRHQRAPRDFAGTCWDTLNLCIPLLPMTRWKLPAKGSTANRKENALPCCRCLPMRASAPCWAAPSWWRRPTGG